MTDGNLINHSFINIIIIIIVIILTLLVQSLTSLTYCSIYQQLHTIIKWDAQKRFVQENQSLIDQIDLIYCHLLLCVYLKCDFIGRISSLQYVTIITQVEHFKVSFLKKKKHHCLCHRLFN